MLSPILIEHSKPAFDIQGPYPNASVESIQFLPCPSPEELAFRVPLSPNTSSASSRPISMEWQSDGTSSDAHDISGPDTPASSIDELDFSPEATSLRREEWLKAMETFPFAGTRADSHNVEDDNRTERSTFTSISEATCTPLRVVRRLEPSEEAVPRVGEAKEDPAGKRHTWPLSRRVSAVLLRRNTVGAESNSPANLSEGSQPGASPSSLFKFRTRNWSIKGATAESPEAARPSMVRRALSLRVKAKGMPDSSTAVQHLEETRLSFSDPASAGDSAQGRTGGDDGGEDEDDTELDEATDEARRVVEKINERWAFEEYSQEEVFQDRYSQFWDNFDPAALSSVADLPQL